MIIVGIDEVGRGSWAGPLCVAAVALEANYQITGLKDSKLLSAKQRLALGRTIRRAALDIGIGWVPAEHLDIMGLAQALRVAAVRALQGITVPFDKIIIDGTVAYIHDPRVTVLPKADNLIPAVSAASVIAKVARDVYMHRMAVRFPAYQFERHVGYGTALHRAALGSHGPCTLHRFSFAPVKALAL